MQEIKTRNAMVAKTTFNEKRTLLGVKLHLTLNKKVITVLKCSEALYAPET